MTTSHARLLVLVRALREEIEALRRRVEALESDAGLKPRASTTVETMLAGLQRNKPRVRRLPPVGSDSDDEGG